MNRAFLYLGLLGIAALPASAGIAYNNNYGGDGYNIDAWTVNTGFVVTNSFVLGSNDTITGVQFAVWAFPGDTLSSIDWTIRANDGVDPLSGTVVAVGTANPTGVFNMTNGFGYSIFDESFNIAGVSLTGGVTYWLQLENAGVANGDPIYWDQSDGPSTYYENTIGFFDPTNPCSGACTGSESFRLLDGTATPEPGTLSTLGAGLMAAAVALRRRRKQ